MNRIARGFYVHYKGPIYFVQSIAINGDTHDDTDVLVVYETTQGCGESYVIDPDKGPVLTDPGRPGPRTRTVNQFVERVNPVTGEAALDGVPRFQRVVGWSGGVPLVMVDGQVELFKPRYKES